MNMKLPFDTQFDPSACAEPETRIATATVEHQQLAENVVIGDIGRPVVGRRDGNVQRRVYIRELLRPGVVEVRQRALLERLLITALSESSKGRYPPTGSVPRTGRAGRGPVVAQCGECPSRSTPTGSVPACTSPPVHRPGSLAGSQRGSLRPVRRRPAARPGAWRRR